MALKATVKRSAGILIRLVRPEGLEPPAYWFEVRLGLREGEIMGLRWQDVDLEAGTLQPKNGG